MATSNAARTAAIPVATGETAESARAAAKPANRFCFMQVL